MIDVNGRGSSSAHCSKRTDLPYPEGALSRTTGAVLSLNFSIKRERGTRDGMLTALEADWAMALPSSFKARIGRRETQWA